MQYPPPLEDEIHRADFLNELGILDTPPDASFDALTRVASAVTGCPIALVSLVDGERQWFKARVGLDTAQTPRDISFCGHAIASDEPLIVEDAKLDPRFEDNPLVTGDPGIRFYAGQPLVVSGYRLGTLCVIDREPRSLDDRQRSVLKDLAVAVSSCIAEWQGRQHWLDQRARLQDYARASGDWLWECAADGSITWLSPGFERKLGGPAADLLGHPPPAGPLFDAHGNRIDPETTFTQLVAAGKAFTRKVLRWSVRGERHWISMSGVPLKSPGQQAGGFRGTAREVTEVMQSQIADREAAELLRRVAEELPGFLFTLAHSRGRGWSADVRGEKTGEVLGVAVGDVKRRPQALLEMLAPKERRAFLRPFLDARRRVTVVSQSVEVQTREGSRKTLRVHARCSALPEGTHVWHGYVLDSDELDQLVTAKEKAREAQQVARARSEFLSSVSHELRTPLNGLLGFTELLMQDFRDPLSAGQRRRLETVLHSGRRLKALIEDVLDLTRIDQGVTALKCEPMLLAPTVERAIEILAVDTQRMGVSIHWQAPIDVLPVWGDVRAVEQILLNLLSNAVKYNRPHGGVYVSARAEGDEVVVLVRDEGIGMTPAQLGQLFQRFNRLGAEHSTRTGTGLGLVISRHLARSMSGDIEATSVPRQGTTMQLRLPRAPEAVDPQREEAVVTGFGSSGLSPLGGGGRLLYIEDETVNALLMTEAVRAASGWEIEVAETGTQGLSLAQRIHPDLIFVDMNLPDIQGTQLLLRLRSLPACRQTRIIALSADAEDSHVAAARNAGADDYWFKPLELSRLRRLLRDT